MTRDDLFRLRQMAFRRFYSRPRFAVRWLMGMRNRAALAAVAKGALSFAALWMRRDAFEK